MPVPIPRERVLDIMKKAGGRPLKAKDVSKQLGLGADERSAVRAALNLLVDEGVLAQLEGRRYVVPGESAGAHRGFVQRKASGSAWFIPDDKRVGDAFVPPHELLGVVDGDRVLARIARAQKGPAAKIVRVLERKRTMVTGTLKDSGKARWVEVDDNVLSGVILIPNGPEGNADIGNTGDVVEVMIVEHPTPVTTAVGRIVRSLGKRGRLDVEVDRIVAGHGIMRAFPPEVEEEAKLHPANPTEEDWRGRDDVRGMPLVTIDGETAKDFDDAVYARVTGGAKGDIEVTVAIADVSHYVRAGAPLDVEAARRGTSIYYPGKVIPMLPEALSNGLCSLKPDVDRLCMCVEFRVRPDGSRHKARFFEAVMKSHARLTYTRVQRIIDDEDLQDPVAAPPLSREVLNSLAALQEASRRLRSARQARGALDFDLPETVIALDDAGEPVKIHALDRLESHKLIEDLMVAANEVVAEEFDERDWPCIYRIHEPPDAEKLERFTKLATLVSGKRPPWNKKGELDGDRDGDGPTPRELMKVMAALADHPAKRALDSLLLRSMMQAKYAADNVGHYGLGSDAYLHFTSPIRRYPDLVVHRLLRDRLRGVGTGKRGKRGKRRDGENGEQVDDLRMLLDDIAARSSECERTATEIERAIDQLYAAWFMKDRVGDVVEAVVQGVAEFGLFMLIKDAHVEGMIRVADIEGDYWELDEVRLRLVGQRSGRAFGIGDVLTVKIAGVDLAKRQIGLVIDDESDGAARAKSGSPKQRERQQQRSREDAKREERRSRREQRRMKRGDDRPIHDGDTRPAAQRADDRGPEKHRRKRDEAKRNKRADDGGARPEPPSDARPGDEHEQQQPQGERPRIRGPEDLRRIFEERLRRGEIKPDGGGKRGGRGGRGGGRGAKKSKR